MGDLAISTSPDSSPIVPEAITGKRGSHASHSALLILPAGVVGQQLLPST
jgi:hypothetical protein